ncbi:MAG: hypothetical protein OXH81_20580 [Gemmatimonadetes bacterium]|nr:hypothetical protein [Gemmatimonadota bacterium]MDE2734729.1 hypothetical protein [Gemmatimonadota bacterium]
MKKHKELIDEWMQEPEFVAEYDALAEEFALFDKMLKARKNEGLTQADVAKKMGIVVPHRKGQAPDGSLGKSGQRI